MLNSSLHITILVFHWSSKHASEFIVGFVKKGLITNTRLVENLLEIN